MCATGPHSREIGFTLVELIAALAMSGLLVVSLLPALARTEPNSKAIRCRENLRRLMSAWSMFSADNSDRVPNNFGVSETTTSISTGTFQNWINNVMTWSASSSFEDRSNTNVLWVTSGILSPYTGGAASIYSCPSDTYISPVQRAAGWSGRMRSYSMNAVFGRFSSATDPTLNGLNWGFPQYRQYLKQAQVPKPAKTWVLIEEHPDSINDGYFINGPTASSWQDIPSCLHDGGCCFSFADAHVELKHWQSSTSCYRVQFSYPTTRAFDALGRADYGWYLARTGWVQASTGLGMFGY